MFKEGDAVVIYPHLFIRAITYQHIALILIQRHDAHRLYLQAVLYKVIQLHAVADGVLHGIQRIACYVFQLLHQLIIGQHMLICQLHFLQGLHVQLLWELLLQKALVVLKLQQVVVMRYYIGQLWVQLILVK